MWTLSQSYLSFTRLDQFCLQSSTDVYAPWRTYKLQRAARIATNVLKSLCLSESFWISAY